MRPNYGGRRGDGGAVEGGFGSDWEQPSSRSPPPLRNHQDDMTDTDDAFYKASESDHVCGGLSYAPDEELSLTEKYNRLYRPEKNTR